MRIGQDHAPLDCQSSERVSQPAQQGQLLQLLLQRIDISVTQLTLSLRERVLVTMLTLSNQEDDPARVDHSGGEDGACRDNQETLHTITVPMQLRRRG